MDGVDVLVLHGAPGAGKTTLSRAVSEVLRVAGVAHAVLDLDDVDRVSPHRGRAFALDNLRALWPSYSAVVPLKMIIAGVVADEQEREALRDAVPGASFTVCELVAPEPVLLDRVAERETGEYWQSRLRGFVELYRSRTDLEGLRDFQVATHGRPVAESAIEVVTKAGWVSPVAR